MSADCVSSAPGPPTPLSGGTHAGTAAKSLEYPSRKEFLDEYKRRTAWVRAPTTAGAGLEPRFFVVDAPGYLYRAYHALPYDFRTSKAS